MKLLLPVDIVHSAKPTIDELKRLVDLKNCQVTMLYVKEELPSYESMIEGLADIKEKYQTEVKNKAQAYFAQAETELKPHCESLKTEIVSGPAAMMIETVARDEKCELTALTPGVHPKIEEFFLGSVSSKVVKHGPGTVLICRNGGKPPEKISKVVIGVDGSHQSQTALKEAVKLFKLKEHGAEITLIHVVSVADVLKMVSPVEYIGIVENNMLMEGETFLANAKQMLAEQGIDKVYCVLKEGDPATEILNLTKSLPADLVVIGAQGRNAVQHFLLGSVSHRIAMHSPVTTAVVKSPRK
ncbi:MAG: universal stress protein [Candidatus Obscuribacterales bacterium]|nr:universal stress protein [Candidatus Obscuribacterales bacterium]